MCYIEDKNIYKVYAKIFRCSSINTDCPLSSNYVELETASGEL
jgi:hypothetical protein